MIQRCTQVEKQQMIELITEIQQIVVNIPTYTEGEKTTATNRLQEIESEMRAFRRRYPRD